MCTCGISVANISAIPETSTSATSSTDAILLVAYVLLALVFSFLCSVAEAVLLSITPSYISGLATKSPKKAALLKKLKQDKIDQSLAAILTLNTIAHTVGAIGSGAKATAVFGSAWFGAFSAVMTLLILFLSEIIPKTLGAVFWRKLTGPTALFIKTLILLLYPLIWVSERLTKLISGGGHSQTFNREEFLAMTGMGVQSGQLKQNESQIIRNLFHLSSLTAQDVMTPRTVVVGFPQGTTVAGFAQAPPQFSRLPVYEKSLDNITGFVLKNDILLYKARDKDNITLESIKREIITIPETKPLPDLLEEFLAQRQHIALVLDEFGGTSGLVTLEDVVETLLGKEIIDEADTVADMQALARKQWGKRAKALGIEVDSIPDKEHS